MSVLGGLACNLGFHFRGKGGRLSELEFFRESYSDQAASFDEFQRAFEKAFGPPRESSPGTEGIATSVRRSPLNAVSLGGHIVKRIGYHPHVHPAQPWCVFDTNLPGSVDVSHVPKIALFSTRQQARDAHPDAVVDPDVAWECQMVFVNVFATAESAAAHVRALAVEKDTFSLALSDELSLGGQVDASGAALAVVVDAVLARGFAPSGFQQREGYRVYDYKRM